MACSCPDTDDEKNNKLFDTFFSTFPQGTKRLFKVRRITFFSPNPSESDIEPSLDYIYFKGLPFCSSKGPPPLLQMEQKKSFPSFCAISFLFSTPTLGFPSSKTGIRKKTDVFQNNFRVHLLNVSSFPEKEKEFRKETNERASLRKRQLGFFLFSFLSIFFVASHCAGVAFFF